MNRKFILAVFAFLLLVFVLQWNAPVKFIWKPTYLHNDKQPFGCAVFDSLMAKSLPNGYTVTDKTLWQLANEKTDKPRAIIVNAQEFRPTKTDQKAMKVLLERGNKLMIIGGMYTPDSTDNIFDVHISASSSFNPKVVQASIENMEIPMDTMLWMEQKPYRPGMFRIYSSMNYGHVIFTGRENLCDTLSGYWVHGYDAVSVDDEYTADYAESVDDSANGGDGAANDEDSTAYYGKEDYIVAEPTIDAVAESPVESYIEPTIVSMKWGKGKVYFNTLPLLFTNYGVLDKEINPLIFRTMSQFEGMPVVRTQAYLDKDEYESESPLRFFLEQSPLRWAVYLALFGLLFFFIFTARRRQRVIPVVERPKNRSLEFVKLIGSLYYQHHNNRDLVLNKYNYFAEYIRRNLMIDVFQLEERSHNVGQIGSHTGIDKEKISALLDRMETISKVETALTDAEMRLLIDEMDNVLNKI